MYKKHKQGNWSSTQREDVQSQMQEGLMDTTGMK